MFIPRHFNVTDWDKIKAFIEFNSFGILTTSNEGKPVATHLPFLLHKEGEDYYLTSHLAYANPQWKSIKNGNNHALIIFQGPHTYVSSSWYEEEEVPTWNYQSVHVYGKAKVMSDEELEEDLILLLEKYESHRENPVLWEKLTHETKKQMKGIVGVRIKVDEVQAAYKLSQNRKKADYENIIRNLLKDENPQSRQVGEVMKNRI